MKTLVVASGLERLDALTDFLQFSDYARYPGSIWYHALAKVAADRGLEIIGVDAALVRVKEGSLSPSAILLIQERESRSGEKLLSFGARGAVLTCLESPMYASKFYQRLSTISASFHTSFLFPSFINKSRSTKSKTAFFPRLLTKEISSTGISSQDRAGFAVIATYRDNPMQGLDGRARIGLVRHALLNSDVRYGLQHHLLKLRTKVIAKVVEFDKISIYGKNWPTPAMLASNNPENIVMGGACENKMSVLRMHRFNICLENSAIPGYVTEKFADAVEADCVPIYEKKNFLSIDTKFFPPFVDANELIGSTNPSKMLSDVAQQFDQWSKLSGTRERFLDLFSHVKFAHQVIDSIEPCLK